MLLPPPVQTQTSLLIFVHVLVSAARRRLGSGTTIYVHRRTVAEGMPLGGQWGGSLFSVITGRGVSLGAAMGLGSGIRIRASV